MIPPPELDERMNLRSRLTAATEAAAPWEAEAARLRKVIQGGVLLRSRSLAWLSPPHPPMSILPYGHALYATPGLMRAEDRRSSMSGLQQATGVPAEIWREAVRYEGARVKVTGADRMVQQRFEGVR